MPGNKGKGSTATAPEKGIEVKKDEATALAPQMDYGAWGGGGFENQTNDDITIPFLGVLQPMSPEVSGESQLDGAKAGMLFNTVTQELFDGKAGIVFQPCMTQHVFVEWKPRESGGGFVAIHDLDSEVVAKARSEATQFGRYKTPEGNDLIETFYVYGMLLDDPNQTEIGQPMTIAFTSTKIKVYKRLMTRLRTFMLPGGGKPPMFAHRVIIKSVSEKNNKGTFFNFQIDPVNGDVLESLIPAKLGDAPHPLLVAGAELNKALRSGATRAAYEKQGGAGGGEGEEVPF